VKQPAAFATTCVLQGLWRFVAAQSVEVEDATSEVRELAASFTLHHLQHRKTWRELTVLVEVEPDEDFDSVTPVNKLRTGL
jgi:spore coat polysaccharide biosynthesis protein SpsF (cytidylyltransferase family)